MVFLTLRMLRSFSKTLDYYSEFIPSALSIKQFVDFGQTNPSEDMSYLFLQKEIPVRLANMMREINYLPDNLLKMPSIQTVQSWYKQSFIDVLKFENIHPSLKVKHDFVETLIRIRNRHMNVVETVAQGLNEMRDMYGEQTRLDGNIQYFLDRFFLSRISIRMLITQHTMMFGGIIPDHPRNVGCIDPHCNIQAVVEDAFENARFVCDNYYMASPGVEITSHNVKTPGSPIHIVYVPSHLYHILFEIFKNALRATIEYHGIDNASYPKVKTLIVKGKEDLTIKISDQGGGVPLSKYGNLFQYTYTTAPRPSVKDPATSPMAGYGFGLPLSRLYARYFQGDLKIISLEGYGIDAIIYIKALPNAASELLPVFNKAVTKFYKSSTSIGEYSGSPNVFNLGDPNASAHKKLTEDPYDCLADALTAPTSLTSASTSSLSDAADTYFTNPDIKPKAYEPPLSYEYYLYLLKKKYGQDIPQHLLDNLSQLESISAFNVAEFENSLHGQPDNIPSKSQSANNVKDKDKNPQSPLTPKTTNA